MADTDDARARHELGTTPSQVPERAAEDRSKPGQVQDAEQPPTNPVERAVRSFDCWQQRHTVIAFPIAVVKKFGDDEAGNLVSLLAYYAFLAAFPLLLAFTAVLSVALRSSPELHAKLVNSALAGFPSSVARSTNNSVSKPSPAHCLR